MCFMDQSISLRNEYLINPFQNGLEIALLAKLVLISFFNKDCPTILDQLPVDIPFYVDFSDLCSNYDSTTILYAMTKVINDLGYQSFRIDVDPLKATQFEISIQY